MQLQLASGDEEELPPPPNTRAHRAEAQWRSVSHSLICVLQQPWFLPCYWTWILYFRLWIMPLEFWTWLMGLPLPCGLAFALCTSARLFLDYWTPWGLHWLLVWGNFGGRLVRAWEASIKTSTPMASACLSGIGHLLSLLQPFPSSVKKKCYYSV